MKPVDKYFSRENRYSLGIDEESGRHYASIPVSNGPADYEEYYELTDEEFERFLADRGAAVAFIEESRRGGWDYLLMQKPGWNRCIAT